MKLSFLMIVFEMVHSYQKTTWLCPNIKLSYSMSKLSSDEFSFGHYLGSCLRKKSKNGVQILCEEETFCGTGLKSHDELQNSVNQSQLSAAVESSNKTCHAYLTIVDVTDDEKAGDVVDCDVIERQLMEMWKDVNDCVGVYCNSTPHSKCVDRLGYYECVDTSGKATESKRHC